MEKLHEAVTEEMIQQAKEKFKNVKVASLFDSEGNSLGELLIGTPSAWAIKEFEKQQDSFKARAVLINGIVCLDEQKKIVNSWERNSEAYAAAFDAAAQMLPVGKAIVKNV